MSQTGKLGLKIPTIEGMPSFVFIPRVRENIGGHIDKCGLIVKLQPKDG